MKLGCFSKSGWLWAHKGTLRSFSLILTFYFGRGLPWSNRGWATHSLSLALGLSKSDRHIVVLFGKENNKKLHNCPTFMIFNHLMVLWILKPVKLFLFLSFRTKKYTRLDSFFVLSFFLLIRTSCHTFSIIDKYTRSFNSISVR